MDKFYVIGGQYAYYNYGGTDTLLKAKRLAARNEEHWDNWQGWHRPMIYAAEDCVEANTFFGRQIVPGDGASPVAVWDGKKWGAD